MTKMKNFKVVTIVIFLAIVLLFSQFNLLFSNYLGKKMSSNFNFTKSDTHNKILIIGDSNFTAINGVINPAAAGDEFDPFIIAHWEIDGGGTGNCIEIINTTKYFEVYNCSTINSEIGIRLENVINGEIFENNITQSTDHGIYLINVNNTNVNNNSINGIGNTEYVCAGIYLENSFWNNFIGNNISDILSRQGATGGFTVTGGTGGTSAGLYLLNSVNNTIKLNKIWDIEGGRGGTGGFAGTGGTGGIGVGIYLLGSEINNITRNQLSDIKGGIRGNKGSSYRNNGLGGEGVGIYFSNSQNNNAKNNSMTNLFGGVSVAKAVGYGIYFKSDSYENSISFDNLLDGSSIIYLFNQTNQIIEGYNLSSNSNPTNFGIITLINCKNITIINNSVANYHGHGGRTGTYGNDGTPGQDGSGIYLLNSDNNSILNNIVYNITGGTGGSAGAGGIGGFAGRGIGINLQSSDNNSLKINNIKNITGGIGGLTSYTPIVTRFSGGDGVGIALFNSNFTTVFNNNISFIEGIGGANGIGVNFLNSVNNTLKENYFNDLFGESEDIFYGFGIYFDEDSYQNTIFSNNYIEINPIIYLFNQNNQEISDYLLTGIGNPTNLGKIVLINCTNIEVIDNNISYFQGATGSGGAYSGSSGGYGVGIYLLNSINCNISNNIINNITGGVGGDASDFGGVGGRGGAGAGIYFSASVGNAVYGNVIADICGGVGGEGLYYGPNGADGVGFGIFLEEDSYQNEISFNNTIDGAPIIFLYNKTNLIFDNLDIIGQSNPTNIPGKIALINSNNITIENNTIGFFRGESGISGELMVNGKSGAIGCGIYLLNSHNNTIINNLIFNITGGTGGSGGILSAGGMGGVGSSFYLKDSLNNEIKNNSIYNITGGVGGISGTDGYGGGGGGMGTSFYLLNSYNNLVDNNTIDWIMGGQGGLGYEGRDAGGEGGNGVGTYFKNSSINVLSNNKFSNIFGGIGGGALYGFYLGTDGTGFGIYIEDDSYNNNILFNNLIQNDPIIYLYNISDQIIENLSLTSLINPTNLGAIVLLYCNNITIRNNTIQTFNGENGITAVTGGTGKIATGVYLLESHSNHIYNNYISHITGGIGGTACDPEENHEVGGVGGLGTGLYLDISNNNEVYQNIIEHVQGGNGGLGGNDMGDGGVGGIATGISILNSNNNSVVDNKISFITAGEGGHGYEELSFGGPGGNGGVGSGLYVFNSLDNEFSNNSIFNIFGGKGGLTGDSGGFYKDGNGGIAAGIYITGSPRNIVSFSFRNIEEGVGENNGTSYFILYADGPGSANNSYAYQDNYYANYNQNKTIYFGLNNFPTILDEFIYYRVDGGLWTEVGVTGTGNYTFTSSLFTKDQKWEWYYWFNDTNGASWNTSILPFWIINYTGPELSGLTEIDPLEIGHTEIISIDVFSKLYAIDHVSIEFDSTQHIMNWYEGNTWIYDNWIPSSLGSHPYIIYANDSIGNWILTNDSIIVQDTTAPEIVINSPSGNYYNSAPLMDVDFVDVHSLEAAYYQVDDWTPLGQNITNWTIIFTNSSSSINTTNFLLDNTIWNSLNERNHTIYFKTWDDLNNTIDGSSPAWMFYKDTKIQTPLDISAEPAGWTNNNSFNITWNNPTDLSGITGIYFSIDAIPGFPTDGTYVPGTNISQLTGVSVNHDGNSTIYIWLQDTAGNIDHLNRTSVSVYYDSSISAPIALTATPSDWTNVNSFNISWINPPDLTGVVGAYYKIDSAPENNTDGIYVSGVNLTEITGITVNNESIHPLFLWLEDSVGNIYYLNSSLTNLYFDETILSPSGLTAVPSGWTNQNSFNLSWINPTELSGITALYYSIDSIPINPTNGTYVLGINISQLTGISVTHDGNSTIYIWLRDTAGNIDHLNRTSVSVYYDSSISAPIGLAATPSDWTNVNSFNISWINPPDLTGIVGAFYKLYSEPINNTDGVYIPGTDITEITGITVNNDSAHDIYVWLNDTLGNIYYINRSQANLHYDSTVLPPLNPTSEPSDWTENNNFKISWTNPSDFVGMKGVYYKFKFKPIHNNDGIYIESSNISEFSVQAPENGPTLIYIWLKDNLDNINYEECSNLTLYLDESPPLVPEIYKIEKSGDSIEIIWHACINPETAYYKIYQSNQPIITTDNLTAIITVNAITTSFEITGLSDGQYCYAITSVNNLGRESDVSVNAVVEITHQKDTTTSFIIFIILLIALIGVISLVLIRSRRKDVRPRDDMQGSIKLKAKDTVRPKLNKKYTSIISNELSESGIIDIPKMAKDLNSDERTVKLVLKQLREINIIEGVFTLKEDKFISNSLIDDKILKSLNKK